VYFYFKYKTIIFRINVSKSSSKFSDTVQKLIYSSYFCDKAYIVSKY